MLAPSRNQRAEAKYNVTTEFPYLGLHSASASGDIGLVQYALSHGQPVNSVLDGVLPLHAACAGGNDVVVRLLINYGADVNAARLPRRYSDRSRDVTAPIVGTSGSTPLHFAAANGHLTVVRTLLAHGAIPDRADKHGITPERIARENGWIECADLLAGCVASMREKERFVKGDLTPDSDNVGKDRGTQCAFEHLESSLRKRLNFKRSVDQALNTLKSGNGAAEIEAKSDLLHPNLSQQDQAGEPYSATCPVETGSDRRPSLPHIDRDPAPRTPYPSRSRRPRSAGTGAEVPPPRKLHSKLSLLTLFRKSNVEGSGSSTTSASEQVARSPPSSSPIPFTASPASGPIGLPVSPRNFPVSLSSSPRDTPYFDHQRRRMESNTSAPGVKAYPPQHADLQGVLASSSPRHRSASGESASSDQSEGRTSDGLAATSSGASVRPGILLMHNRTSSGHGISVPSVSSSRNIRFQRSTSSISSLGGRSRNPSGRGAQSLRSLNLSSNGQREEEYDDIPTIEESPVVPPQATPPIFVNRADDDDEPEEEYGVPLDNTTFPGDSLHYSDSLLARPQLPFSINVPPPIDDPVASASMSENRLRGDSISSTGTTGTTSTFAQSSSSEAAWSVGTPSTPHLSPGPTIVSALGEVDPESGLSRHKKSVLLDLDVSAISSHAQAEELVQRTQQSIMKMEQYLEENTKKDVGTGRTPLSMKLAAYGESLAIERRLKEEARVSNETAVADVKKHDPPGRSLLSATKPSMSDNVLSKSSSASASFGESTTIEVHADRAQRTTRSASDDIRDTSHLDPSSLGATECFMYTPPRPRTPDFDLDRDLIGGRPISRIPATPSTNFPRNRSRDGDPMRSAQKLSRMGFSTMDSWQPPPFKGDSARSPPPKHLFGGIRTLMQSLQGK